MNTTPILSTFAQAVATLRRGELEDEISAQLRKLLAQCTDTGRAGELGVSRPPRRCGLTRCRARSG